MNCHMRMSHIILLLLWTLCYSGTGSSRNNDNGQSDTSTTSGNRNVSITASSTQPLHNLSPKGTNKLQLVTTVTTPIPNNEAVQKEQLKITVRSKLWSPYRNVVDDFLEENEDDERISTAPSTFSTGKSISTQSQSGGNEIQALNDEKMSDSPQKRPIISSIRHYRSRKSFVRTRKTPSDPSIVKSQSDLTAKSSHVVDLDDEEQGDQPFSHASTDAKVASGGVRSFGKLVEGKPSTKTGQSSSSTTTSSSGSISVETDGEMVYGIPYFISPTVKVGNTSTKAQKIDKLLLPKKTLMPIITSSNIRNSSISSSDRRIASPESYSTDTRYGAPVLQPTLDNKFTTKDSSVNSSNKARQQQISPQPTKKAKGGGGGGGKRSRGGKAAGTRKPEYADGDENKAPDDDGFGRISSSPNPSLSLDKRRNGKKKKIGGDFQHDAFRKVKEKTRKASRLPADIRDQSDYKSNYNLEPLSNDNDPMGGGGGAASPETQDQSRPWENLANNGGGVHVESEYFPNALDEGTRERSGAFKDDDDEASNPVESDDEYDHVATSSASPSQNEKPGSDIVTVFLRIVESQHTLGANCTRGTDFNLGDGVVDRYAQERFRLEAELTVNRANMLTRFWKYAEPKSLEDEYLLHAMVISLIEFDEDIFAAGNCYDENQYKNYTLFCPYGYREQDGSILVKDLSLEYPYLSNTSEWFYKARKDAEIVIKNYNQFRRGSHSFRWNETNLVEEEILNVTYEDGKWSKPYFDCGGGNIWMITYMVPFFGYNGHNETYYFKGTSGIDIDLRRVDIDQCPLPANSTELNIFAASDKCKNATTKCVPLKGLGFRRGSYRCICKDGFYFPNVSSAHKYFNGTLLEEEYEKKFTGFWQNETSLYDMDGLFECLPCPFGCDTCVDDRPCVVSLNWLMRTAILILQGAIIAMLPIVGLFTYKYSNVKVVRAASPVLLRFIVLGAFFIYCTILVNYPSPSVITCTLRVWLREIGFSLAYGSLLLKTWRISVIFRVRSAKAIKITDLDLMKRLGAIVGTFTSLLVIRTLVAPPIAIVSYTADELKAWLCKSDWWDHSMMIMELCFLVWGIRLCIVVRKAPSEFNESKFISLAIYNEFLLSLFLNISMLFLQVRNLKFVHPFSNIYVPIGM